LTKATYQALGHFAAVLAAGSRNELAARVLGMIDAGQRRIGFPMSELNTDHADVLAAVRASVGEETFNRLWDEGQRTALSEGIALLTAE
jgi:hypothetical protein